MSIHNSLVPPSKLKRHRNVLSREERLAKLVEEGKWNEEGSIYGLPKIRNIMAKPKAKVKKVAEGAAAEGAVAAEGAAAPAAGAAGKTPAAAAGKAPAAAGKAPAGDKKPAGK